MRILVVGAGAIGGYFGGRLLEAGRDVTFLVRPRRAAQLATDGLVIESRHGNVRVTAPPHVLADRLTPAFDLVLLSCKAYDLAEAMKSFAPAVGPQTAILPLLNGMRQLELLEARFGAEPVLGGQCLISATLDAAGTVHHIGDAHALTFGERDGTRSGRIAAIAAEMQGVRFAAGASDTILLDMWEKWVFLATLAGITCLMQGSIGDIVAAGGTELVEHLFEECRTIAADHGYAPRPHAVATIRTMLVQAGSPLTASMLRDLERGAAIEADHILGDLLRRRRASAAVVSLLQTAYTRLAVYEAHRMRREAEARAGKA